MSCDESVQGLAHSPLPALFFSDATPLNFQKRAGALVHPLTLVSYIIGWSASDLPWDFCGTLWYLWYQILLHDLISKISDIATAWTASIIIFSGFLIEISQAKWMQAHMPSVIHALFSEKHGIPYGYSLSCRPLWILSLASP